MTQQAIAKTAPKSLSFEDRVKSMLRTLAQRLSDKDLAPSQLTLTYNVLKDWRENLVALEDNAKARLLKIVSEKGAKVSDAGTMKAMVDGWVLEARPSGAKWDDKKVLMLLASKGLPEEKWMKTTVKYAVDEAKLAALVELGKLTEAEVASCRASRGFALQPPRTVAEVEDDEG